MRVSFDHPTSVKVVSATPDKNTFPYYSIGTFWKEVWKLWFYFWQFFQTQPQDVQKRPSHRDLNPQSPNRSSGRQAANIFRRAEAVHNARCSHPEAALSTIIKFHFTSSLRMHFNSCTRFMVVLG